MCVLLDQCLIATLAMCHDNFTLLQPTGSQGGVGGCVTCRGVARHGGVMRGFRRRWVDKSAANSRDDRKRARTTDSACSVGTPRVDRSPLMRAAGHAFDSEVNSRRMLQDAVVRCST